jgi:hypothetical protein
MPSYAICGTVEAKPLNVQRSIVNVLGRVQTNRTFEAILPWKLFWVGNAHGSIILPMIAR